MHWKQAMGATISYKHCYQYPPNRKQSSLALCNKARSIKYYWFPSLHTVIFRTQYKISQNMLLIHLVHPWAKLTSQEVKYTISTPEMTAAGWYRESVILWLEGKRNGNLGYCLTQWRISMLNIEVKMPICAFHIQHFLGDASKEIPSWYLRMRIPSQHATY